MRETLGFIMLIALVFGVLYLTRVTEEKGSYIKIDNRIVRLGHK
jgi:hypothetical protein